MSATAATVRLTKCRGNILGVLPGVGGFQMFYMKYLSIVTTSQVPCYPLTTNTAGLRSVVGAVLSGAEEALPRRMVARLLKVFHFVSDAMHMHMVQLQYAGRRATAPWLHFPAW